MQRIPVCVECESCPTSKFRAHPTPGPGATALAVLARCSFLFVPKNRVFTVVFTGIFTEDSPREDGTKTRQFSTFLTTQMPLSARVPRPKTSPLCGRRGPRGGPRAALGRESHGGRRGPARPGSPGARDAARKLREASTGSKGTHSESRGSGETFHGARWVIYIVTRKNKSPRYLNRMREKN